MKNNTALKYSLFAIFALSGFSGLIYESIWTHYIKLLLGHAAYAQTLVLAIFMGGMAIGAALTARKNKPIKYPLRTYAIIEGIIGVFAIVFHNVFISTESLLHETLIPAVDSVILIEIMRWSIAALLILPQSILLGTTFPLIGSAIIRLDKQHSGSTLGMLYFTNSIGAAIGVLVSAFVLISLVGLPGTILTAGLINFVIAIVVWGLSKNEISLSATSESNEPSLSSDKNKFIEKSIPEVKNYNFDPKLLLIIALLTGLASFFYEIGWIRMLSLVLGSSMQAFEIMLSAFITGIALGGLWIKKRIEGTKNPVFFLGKIQIIMGLCALLTLPLYSEMFNFMDFLIKSLNKNDGGYLLFNLGSHTIAMMVMLPATFMAGMTLPLITFLMLQLKQGEGSIGKVYAFNTVGAIIGILLAIHIAMPLVGTRGLIISGAILDVCLGGYLIVKFMNRENKLKIQLSGIAVLLISFFIITTSSFDQKTLSSGVYRSGLSSFLESKEMLYYQDGKTASISVSVTQNGMKIISTNGKPDAGISAPESIPSADEPTMIILGALPLAIHPEAKTVANIGMGSGLTSHTILTSPTITSLDTIEIEASVISAIKHFGKQTSNALNDPRSNIIIDDAKSFFSRNKKKYDIIISEPSNPWVSGVAGLFSTEFYKNINQYLNDDGIFVQWLQLYETNIHLTLSAITALSENFEDYAIYNSVDSDIIIVASNKRKLTQLDSSIFASKTFSNQLARVNITTIEDLSSRLLISKKMLQPYLDSSIVTVNSDYFPYIALNAPKARFLGQDALELSELHLALFPPAQFEKKIVSKNPSGIAFTADAYRKQSQMFMQKLLNQNNSKLNKEYEKTSTENKNLLSNLVDTLNQCNVLNDDIRQNLFMKNIETMVIFSFQSIFNADVNKFWSQLGDHKCYSKLSDDNKLWISLYTSIANKDHNKSIFLLNNLFEKIETPSQQQIKFMISSSIYAHMEINNYEEGVVFVKALVKRNEFKSNLSLDLKILIAKLAHDATNSRILN